MPPAPLPFESDVHDLEVSLTALEAAGDAAPADEVRRVRRELTAKLKALYANLSPWDTVLVSRHKDRPQFLDYVDLIFDEFAELHGDRVLLMTAAEPAFARAMQHGPGRHHLGVEPRSARQEAVEEPAVPVRPVHHRRNAELMRLIFHGFH